MIHHVKNTLREVTEGKWSNVVDVCVIQVHKKILR